jgi:superoxide dismutase, Fe-Mn family
MPLQPPQLEKSIYKANDYDHLIGATRFSKELFQTHLKLYNQYVDHTNKVLEMLEGDELDDYAAREVERRFVWEFNGMRLHEYYFDAMSGGGGGRPERDSTLMKAITRDFGDFDTWETAFRTLGKTRGIGWAVLVHDPKADRLLHLWINEHDAGPLAGTNTILIMDMFEHAFIRDFGTDRGKYMDAYFDAVDWKVAEGRYQKAVKNK